MKFANVFSGFSIRNRPKRFNELREFSQILAKKRPPTTKIKTTNYSEIFSALCEHRLKRCIASATNAHIHEHFLHIRRAKVRLHQATHHQVIIGSDSKAKIKATHFIKHGTPHIECRVRWHPSAPKAMRPKWATVPATHHGISVIATHVD